jgi:hypothetical protein
MSSALETEILTRVKKYYESASQNQMMTTWREQSIEDFGFYDGNGQWSEHDIKVLKQRLQPVVTVNKIKAPINNLSGVEIQTRFRTAFRSRSNDPDEAKMAEALTNLGYFIQEDQDVPYKQSLKFRDHLICGLGWSQYIKVGNQYQYEYVHPSEMVFDPEDLTPQLTNSTFVARVKWLPLKDALDYFPSKAKELKELENKYTSYGSSGVMSGEVADRYLGSGLSYFDTQNASGTRLRVIEVQYKKPATLYSTLNKQGKMIQSFTLKDLKKVAADPQKIDQHKTSEIFYAFYTEGVLLDHGSLNLQPLGTGDFSYVPLVFNRRYDGVPYGLVADAKDVQRDANKRRSKLLHLLNSVIIEADGDAFEGWDREQIRQEAGRPDAVFLLSKEARFNRSTNPDLAKGQFDLLQETDKEIQQTMGIYSEQIGDQTNAESGIAIQQRQINSVRNQIFAFDNLRMMKKREGRLLLSMLQASSDTNLLTQIIRNGELVESLVLNRVIENKGKLVIENDIRQVDLDVYVEEVKEFESQAEEQAQTLKFLLEHPQGLLLMQSPELMRRFGLKEGDKIAQELTQVLSKAAEQAPQ